MQRRHRPATDDASPNQRARTEGPHTRPANDATNPNQRARAEGNRNRSANEDADPILLPRQPEAMPAAMASLLATAAMNVAPDADCIRAAVAVFPGIVPVSSACPRDADPAAAALLVALLKTPTAPIPPANLGTLGVLVATIGRKLWAAAAAEADRSLSQTRAAARPYIASMQGLRLDPVLLTAIDDRNTPRGLNASLEAHRLAALTRMPQEAIAVVTGSAAIPTTVLGVTGVRLSLGLVLAPLLAAELSGAVRSRVSLLTAQAILFGDDAALDQLDMPTN